MILSLLDLHLYISSLVRTVRVSKTVMYLSTEARPGPSQTIKIKLFARIVNVFKLTLLTTLVKSTIVDV